MAEIHVAIGLRATSRTARHGTEREKHILTRGKSVEEVHGMFVLQTTGSSERNGHCDRLQSDPQLRQCFLEMQRRWLSLARSYEFAEPTCVPVGRR